MSKYKFRITYSPTLNEYWLTFVVDSVQVLSLSFFPTKEAATLAAQRFVLSPIEYEFEYL
ncbi:hypothetical protein [Paralysiella testudinis]|uniref:Uncharacterized protein n=1 Tax=Paralysiella testudinis TaxID=2809020 RepID=A0A892ZH65_9NEIS|nr:hypothetical protein [Paralysiella testudinis]QRQ81798.1 hypothetical protein JQU52_14200 [Paralysiella testudinis]